MVADATPIAIAIPHYSNALNEALFHAKCLARNTMKGTSTNERMPPSIFLYSAPAIVF